MEESPRTWVDIWALCRRDHGLTWAEFSGLTLAQLEALEERRAIAIRHERFNSALVAATLYNVNRTSSDSNPLSPFDFLPGYEIDPKEVEKDKLRRSVKHAVALAMTEQRGLSKEAVLVQKAKMIANMKKSGFEDAEEIFSEVFPDL